MRNRLALCLVFAGGLCIGIWAGQRHERAYQERLFRAYQAEVKKALEAQQQRNEFDELVKALGVGAKDE
jgi:hypothetical protein